MPKKADLLGRRFGRLLVVAAAPNQGRCTVWEVRCDCGATKEVRTDSLRSGNTSSCGCLVGQGMRKHGEARKTAEYTAWQLMKQRAGASKGRICVASRWKYSYGHFLEDMRRKSDPDATLDRIDSDGHYEPGNCRWVSRTQQAQNIRSNRLLEHQGEIKCLTQWAREVGLAVTTISGRLGRGWSVERALETPPTHGTFKRKGSLKNEYSAEYSTWSQMKARCYNPDHKNFPTYGGSGVKVCGRWKKSFECFLADMGRRPSAKHSLDRIDVRKGYSPENCRWADARTQQRNRSNNRLITFEGQTRCLQEWAERLGIDHRVIRSRLQRGWDEAVALTTEVSNGSRIS